MALEVEVLEVVRRVDLWDETRIIPAGYGAIFDIAKLQECAGSRNGFEVVIDELIKGLVKAQYRRTVVIWGWLDWVPMTQRTGWWMGLTCAPERRGVGHSLVLLYPKFTFALVEAGGGKLSKAAEPLLKWSPDTGLTRLWGRFLRVPDFARMVERLESRGTHIYAPVSLNSLRGSGIRIVGGETFQIRNRRYKLRRVDLGLRIMGA